MSAVNGGVEVSGSAREALDQDRAASAANPTPTAEDVAKAPVVIIEGVPAGGTDKAGSAVRLCVYTKSQGFVQLHLSRQILDQLIKMGMEFRNKAQLAAAQSGGSLECTIYPVNAFRVGEMEGVEGVVMTLNQQMPGELMFNLPESQFAIQLGQGLIKQGGISAQKERLLKPPKGKLILPGH